MQIERVGVERDLGLALFVQLHGDVIQAVGTQLQRHLLIGGIDVQIVQREHALDDFEPGYSLVAVGAGNGELSRSVHRLLVHLGQRHTRLGAENILAEYQRDVGIGKRDIVRVGLRESLLDQGRRIVVQRFRIFDHSDLGHVAGIIFRDKIDVIGGFRLQTVHVETVGGVFPGVE